MQNSDRRISVIMPALNEEKNIRAAIYNVLSAFEDYNLQGEIMVVNDGSVDKTEALIKEAMLENNRYEIKLIKHDKPKGIGASFWEGVDSAVSEVVVMLPGDNENDPGEIFRYYDLLKHVDIVIPFIFNKQIRPFFRNALSFTYKFVINAVFFVNFNYTMGTILYRKSILQKLSYRSSSFFFQTDILVRTARKGYLFAEVPSKLGLRESGVSKAVSFFSLSQIIKGYFILLKDIYFNNDLKVNGHFSDDSVSAVRWKENVYGERHE